MAMIRDLDWDPSKDPVVNPRTRIRCTSCIGPPTPRVLYAFAVLSQTYYYPEKTLSITSIEEGWKSKDLRGWKADLRVSTHLEGTAEELFMLSCKSLICLYGVNDSYICNPTTKEVRHLKKLHERDGIGFGFDATKNKYKLVLLHLSGESTWCEIFTLGTNSWSRAKNEDQTMPRTNNGKASMHIISFNVQSGKFKWICLPVYIQTKKKQLEQNIHISLVQVLGSLSLVQHSGVDKRLDIWIQKEGTFRSDDVFQWTIKYSINLRKLPDHTAPGYPVTLIGILDAKIILWSTWIGLVSYDLRTQVFESVYQPSGWNQEVVYQPSGNIYEGGVEQELV
ncbi:hypothetical protein MKW98_022206 [Papaver atlanticum]|uniref:F-box associated beta-propeller type 3 domain-containing protein n=1 Tax=Papaver atlanticum TaxID=357466 RepID=A0AAD4T7B3_9MAGN|nr:hypothetical protein MKW98_022206 [Papaver atlanticum]